MPKSEFPHGVKVPADLANAGAALYFLHNVEPLNANSYDDDERFEFGRNTILAWIEAVIRTECNGDY